MLLLRADPESHPESTPEISALPQVWRPARVSLEPRIPTFFAPAVRKEGRVRYQLSLMACRAEREGGECGSGGGAWLKLGTFEYWVQS